MTGHTGEIDRFAAAVAKRQAADEAAAYLKKLAFRRNLCWIAAGICFLFAGLLSVAMWTEKIKITYGVISWLGPGLTTFGILGAMAIQQAINKRLALARIDRAEARLREESRALAETLQVRLDACSAAFEDVSRELGALRNALEAAKVAGNRPPRESPAAVVLVNGQRQDPIDAELKGFLSARLDEGLSDRD